MNGPWGRRLQSRTSLATSRAKAAMTWSKRVRCWLMPQHVNCVSIWANKTVGSAIQMRGILSAMAKMATGGSCGSAGLCSAMGVSAHSQWDRAQSGTIPAAKDILQVHEFTEVTVTVRGVGSIRGVPSGSPIESFRLPFIVQTANGKSLCNIISLTRISLPNV